MASRALVNTLGILGEKYIEIIPGSDYSATWKSGDVVIGEDPISMEELSSLGRKIALNLEDSVEGFNDIVKDPDTQASLKEMIAHLNSITRKIDEGYGTLGQLLNNDSIYKDLEILSDDLKKHPWKLIHRGK